MPGYTFSYFKYDGAVVRRGESLKLVIERDHPAAPDIAVQRLDGTRIGTLPIYLVLSLGLLDMIKNGKFSRIVANTGNNIQIEWRAAENSPPAP